MQGTRLHNELHFTVYLEPKGQMRPRSAVVQSKNTGRHHAVSHTDKKQRLYAVKLVELLAKYAPEEPLDGPLLLGVRAIMPIPKSKSKKWKAAAAAGEIRPETKPDLDNILKNIKDAMNGVFWRDDKQVVGYIEETGKFYGESPRYEVTIRKYQGKSQGSNSGRGSNGAEPTSADVRERQTLFSKSQKTKNAHSVLC